ncbi:hypothetical protein BGZ95_006414 [Linnemannia exigua]|uniref:Uncharacterized protein n=1 Tax=Linnemannia exigua TaxID=604196 RepID=A0AAD4HCG5_9FUNG|nr:hypothetical protein BGZ95_006414 [Linnemannia exigua]
MAWAAISSSNTSPGWGQLCSLRVTHSPNNNYLTLTVHSGRSTGETGYGSEEQMALVQAVWKLAQQNSKTLTTFRLDQSFAKPRILLLSSDTTEAMYNALKNLPNLTELEIANASADLDKVLELTSPHLECLRAPGLFQMMGTDGQLLHGTYRNIREVELLDETDTRAVFSLLRYLPNLESLSLSEGFDQEFFQNDEVETMEARTRMDNTPNRSLHKLRLFNARFQDTRIMAIILAWIPELREFSCELLKADMSKALAEHCEHLEIVRELDSFGGRYDARTNPRPIDTVLPLLRGCPSLKVLDTVTHRVLGDSFVNCEIACLERLETFRCQIVGMYWLDNCPVVHRVLTGYNGDDEGVEGSDQWPGLEADKKEFFDLVDRNLKRYREVYKQLSKMTQLRVLELGQEYRTVYEPYDGSEGDRIAREIHSFEDELNVHPEYNWYREPIEDTLTLTLGSGFDQLEALKELEVFGFEGTDHQFEKADLEWMAEKWPKLKVMRGIHEDVLPRVAPDANRTELREYMQLLRPDVVHETLSKSFYV